MPASAAVLATITCLGTISMVRALCYLAICCYAQLLALPETKSRENSPVYGKAWKSQNMN